MNKIIHKIKSAISNCYKAYPRWQYSRKQAKNEPIKVTFPDGISFNLYPWGQIVKGIYTGNFEKAELELVALFLKKGMNVIDAGANIGVYSILAATLIGKSGRVWSFEPSGQTHNHLLNNLSLNNIDSVIPNKAALSDIPDCELLLKRSSGCGDAERYLSSHPNHPSNNRSNANDPGDSELVKVTSLDSYMDNHLSDVKIDFLKIDVEGNEFPLLRGSEKLLRANPDIVIMLECNPVGCSWAGHKVEDVVDFLKKLGLDLFCWDQGNRQWISDLASLSTAGNLWATSDKECLPKPLHS